MGKALNFIIRNKFTFIFLLAALILGVISLPAKQTLAADPCVTLGFAVNGAVQAPNAVIKKQAGDKYSLQLQTNQKSPPTCDLPLPDSTNWKYRISSTTELYPADPYEPTKTDPQNIFNGEIKNQRTWPQIIHLPLGTAANNTTYDYVAVVTTSGSTNKTYSFYASVSFSDGAKPPSKDDKSGGNGDKTDPTQPDSTPPAPTQPPSKSAKDINTDVTPSNIPDYDAKIGKGFFNPLGSNVDTVPKIIVRLIQILLAVVAGLTVITIIVAGFRMVLSSGNEEQVKKAKQALTWAVIGFVVSLLAFSIVAIIQRII